jgi:hypothetical protein
MYLQRLLQGCLQPDIRHTASTVQGNVQINLPRNTGSSSGLLLNKHDGIKQSSLHVLIT